MKSLVKKNKPTQEYLDLLNAQREWLHKTGTTTARAKYVLEININLLQRKKRKDQQEEVTHEELARQV